MMTDTTYTEKCTMLLTVVMDQLEQTAPDLYRTLREVFEEEVENPHPTLKGRLTARNKTPEEMVEDVRTTLNNMANIGSIQNEVLDFFEGQGIKGVMFDGEKVERIHPNPPQNIKKLLNLMDTFLNGGEIAPQKVCTLPKYRDFYVLPVSVAIFDMLCAVFMDFVEDDMVLVPVSWLNSVHKVPLNDVLETIPDTEKLVYCKKQELA